MKKILRRWLVKIILDGQNSELREIEGRIIAYRGMLRDIEERFIFYKSSFKELSDKVGNCYMCQYDVNELERRIGVSEVKQERLKTKAYHFFKKVEEKISNY